MNHRYLTMLMALGLLFSKHIQAQFSFHQDCASAIPLCNGRYVFPYAFDGNGVHNELNSIPTCLAYTEQNSSWYKLAITGSGYLAFSIAPLGPNDDYDFALFDITGRTCADIPDTTAPSVRCNYAGTRGAATGLNSAGMDTTAAVSGPAFLQWLAVDSGDVLALVITNLNSYGQGFVLDFAGSTATFASQDSLQIGEAFTAICTDYLQTELYFNQPIDSNSFSSDFSELLFTDNTGDTLVITGVYFDSVPNKLWVVSERPNHPIDSVLLAYRAGTDGNTIAASCNSQFLPTDTYNFNYLWNNMGTQGFTVTNIGSSHSFRANVANVAFVDWYVNGTFLIKRQASMPFNYNLTEGQTYRICMVAELGCNKDSTCQTVMYTGVGIADVSHGLAFTLYPNPANSIVTIAVPYDTGRIELLDINGKLCQAAEPTNQSSSHTFDIQHLPSGLYLVRVTGQHGTYVQKLIVSH